MQGWGGKVLRGGGGDGGRGGKEEGGGILVVGLSPGGSSGPKLGGAGGTVLSQFEELDIRHISENQFKNAETTIRDKELLYQVAPAKFGIGRVVKMPSPARRPLIISSKPRSNRPWNYQVVVIVQGVPKK